MMPTYRDLAEDLGLSLRVSFIGSRSFDGVAETYARASVVCIPSRWDEPFGFVAAKAMAMRRPLVAPSGALAELCADDGCFVAVDREPRSIVASLQAAFSDEADQTRRAASAYTFALDRLTADPAGTNYQAVYESVIS